MDGPVRQRSLWEHNLALVLGEVGRSEPTSRARIAQATGLTRATVSALVEVLVKARLVDEVGPAPRGGAGRPATGLVLSTAGPAGLGLEINVDYLAAAVVDLTGAVRHLEVRHADQRGRAPAEVLADVAGLAARAREAVDLPLAAARLAVPGLIGTRRIDPHGGGAPGAETRNAETRGAETRNAETRALVRLAPNLGWRDLDVLGPLTADPRWPGLPADIDNEANLAALGELSTADRERSFLYVSGEVGIGAGIVLDGALLRGTHGWSGEIGHVTIAADGPTCRCGARGCLEQYAGQEAILRAAGVPAGEPLPADLAVRRLAELAGAADPAAVDALAAAGTALGIAAAGVVNLLDLDAVVLGGSFAPLAGWLCTAVERELATRVLTAAWSPVPVRACALGTRAAVVGAAGAVVREVQAAPANWVEG